MATTTNYGWDTPDDTDLVKDGALAMRDLGQDIDTSLFSITGGKNVGAVLINATTLTAVSSINIANCFSADYDNYRIDVNITATTGGGGCQFALRTGSTTLITGYSSAVMFWSGAAATGANRGVTSFFSFASGAGDATSATIFSPFKAAPTKWQAFANQGPLPGIDAGWNSSTTSYESLNFATSGTLTGTLKIYGLRNS